MMKRILPVLIGLALVSPVSAMDHSKMKGGMDHSKMSGSMDHSKHRGELIHESNVGGYKFAYHLIDNKAQMAKMKDMPGHDMSKMKSHHLMLYVVDPAGKPVPEAKVGFKVEGPAHAEQKVMAMAMAGGFGADVELEGKGRYEIKTKILAGDKKLIDEFEYTAD